MLYQWSMSINTDQCQIKFNVLIAMSINKYQCRSMTINWSILIVIDRHWSLLSCILDQFRKFDLSLIGIDHWYSMSWSLHCLPAPLSYLKENWLKNKENKTTNMLPYFVALLSSFSSSSLFSSSSSSSSSVSFSVTSSSSSSSSSSSPTCTWPMIRSSIWLLIIL